MILLTEAQADAVRGDYPAGRLEPVEAVAGLYYLPERLIGVFPGLDDFPTGDVLEAARDHLLEHIAALRWDAIQNNFSFNGTSVKLDDRAQARMDSAVAGLSRQPEGSEIVWEVSRGVFVTMGMTALEAFGDAAFAHIQACFAYSKPMMEDVKQAADLEALRAIDLTAGWPEE